jgi:hypothetical protein
MITDENALTSGYLTYAHTEEISDGWSCFVCKNVHNCMKCNIIVCGLTHNFETEVYHCVKCCIM